jgi:hypothetical protein
MSSKSDNTVNKEEVSIVSSKKKLAGLETIFSSTKQNLQENNFFKSHVSLKLYN